MKAILVAPFVLVLAASGCGAARYQLTPEEYGRMARVHNPYGDGRASHRISDLILSFFKSKSE